MNFFKNIVLFLSILLVFTSCEKIFMHPNPDTNNLAIFNEYAKIVKEKYAMLEYKGVDIDFLADSIRATITNDLTDAELFQKLSIITVRLRDGHSDLTANLGELEPAFASFNFIEGFPVSISGQILGDHYVGKSVNPTIQFLDDDTEFGFRAIWGTLPQDQEIGYIWIPNWKVEISDDEFENIFTDLTNTKGLIVDMRQNTGGNPALATKFASYFTDTPIYNGFERFKIGPDADDFSDSDLTLQPTSSDNKYLKPVAVLTDRYVYSASTTFLYSVDPLENVTTIGQISGGGSGSVGDGYLANGWKWSLSISEFIDADGRHLDDGVEPDILVVFDLMDTEKDEFIERAILELQ